MKMTVINFWQYFIKNDYSHENDSNQILAIFHRKWLLSFFVKWPKRHAILLFDCGGEGKHLRKELHQRRKPRYEVVPHHSMFEIAYIAWEVRRFWLKNGGDNNLNNLKKVGKTYKMHVGTEQRDPFGGKWRNPKNFGNLHKFFFKFQII